MDGQYIYNLFSNSCNKITPRKCHWKIIPPEMWCYGSFGPQLNIMDFVNKQKAVVCFSK